MTEVCQWCSNTSSKIDSLEYEIEQLRAENDRLRRVQADKPTPPPSRLIKENNK